MHSYTDPQYAWRPTILLDLLQIIIFCTPAVVKGITVVWEKFMVRNIREKKIRGKKFSSMQAIDENFLRRILVTCTYLHVH